MIQAFMYFTVKLFPYWSREAVLNIHGVMSFLNFSSYLDFIKVLFHLSGSLTVLIITMRVNASLFLFCHCREVSHGKVPFMSQPSRPELHGC